MKFLVLGCNGMAGHLISLYLRERGHDVLGFARSHSNIVESVIGDAKDQNLLKEIITKGDFDTVINCIGVLNQFAERNKADAVYLNAFLPHFLAELTTESDTQIIHMSTDCVFSGKTGQYEEGSLRDGTTFYDRSKALGEIEDSKNLTLRQSIVGPDINSKGIGLLNWFLQQRNGVEGYTGAIWTGVTTLQLAKTMEIAAEKKVHGLYNMVPDTWISKYDLLKLFNQYLREEQISITPVNKVAADKSLKRTNFGFDYQVPDYEQMIAELSEWMRNHKNLYPHYQF